MRSYRGKQLVKLPRQECFDLVVWFFRNDYAINPLQVAKTINTPYTILPFQRFLPKSLIEKVVVLWGDCDYYSLKEVEEKVIQKLFSLLIYFDRFAYFPFIKTIAAIKDTRLIILYLKLIYRRGQCLLTMFYIVSHVLPIYGVNLNSMRVTCVCPFMSSLTFSMWTLMSNHIWEIICSKDEI